MIDMKRVPKVRIIAWSKDPKDKASQIAPVYLAPQYDELTKTFTIGETKYKGVVLDHKTDGMEVVSAEGTPISMTNHDSYRFIHLQEFDTTNEIEKFLLSILLSSDMCAKNKGSVNPLQHRYYLENKESEAEETITKYEKSLNALEKINSLGSDDERYDFARLVLKTSVVAYSPKQIHAELIKLAYENPDFIVQAGNDPNKKVRMFLKKLVDNKVVGIRGGKFYNGNDLLGINEDYAVEYLKNPDNSALVEQLAKEVKALTKKKSEKVTE